MAISPLAGQPATSAPLIDPAHLIDAYYSIHPNSSDAGQRVSFGTSGHRGTALNGSFNERHILAIAQAICAYRAQAKISGPLFIGIDTHVLSEPAFMSALEVLAANGVELRVSLPRAATGFDGRRIYADSCGFARDSGLQSQRARGAGGWDRDHAFA